MVKDGLPRLLADAWRKGPMSDSSSCLPVQSGPCELFPTFQFCPGSCHPLSQTTGYPQASLLHTAPERLYQTIQVLHVFSNAVVFELPNAVAL